MTIAGVLWSLRTSERRWNLDTLALAVIQPPKAVARANWAGERLAVRNTNLLPAVPS
jgi:hypothetical protein